MDANGAPLPSTLTAPEPALPAFHPSLPLPPYSPPHELVDSSADHSPNCSETDDEEAESQLRWSTMLPILVFVVIYLLILCLFAFNRQKLMPQLKLFTQWVRGYGFIGYVINALIVVCTCFPPVPAYGLTAVLCGIVYGWLGFFPFYIGAILGADLVFWVFRRYSQGYAHRLMIEHPRVAAVVWAVERKGLKLLFLIRLAPYPFSLMNAILAGSQITFLQFHMATMLTVPKLAVNVGLGAHMMDIADFFDHPNIQGWSMFILFSVVAAVVFVYVAWIGLKEIRQLEKEGTRWNKREKRWVKRGEKTLERRERVLRELEVGEKI